MPGEVPNLPVEQPNYDQIYAPPGDGGGTAVLEAPPAPVEEDLDSIYTPPEAGMPPPDTGPEDLDAIYTPPEPGVEFTPETNAAMAGVPTAEPGSLEAIYTPPSGMPVTAAAAAEVPALPDHSAKWNAEQQTMAQQAAAAGLPPAPSGNARLADAIKRSHEAGYEFPHFTGAFDPTGDRTVTLDMEALVESLQKQEADTTDPALKQKIAREKEYWASEIQAHGMTAEQWKQQTGEPEPVPEPADLTAWLDRMQITDPKERAHFLNVPKDKAFKGERLPWTMGLAKWIDKIARPFTGSKPGELGTLESIAERGTYVPAPEEPSFFHAGIPSIPQQEGKAAQVGAGLANLPIGFANFLLSPGGAATATSIGMLPKIGQILTGAGFTADQVHSFFKAETLQDKVTTALGSALLGLGTALHIRGGGKDATTERQKPESVQAEPKDRTEGGETKEAGVSDSILGAEEVRTEEVTPFDFRPALRTTEGIIEGEVGKTHADIYKAAADPTALRASDPEHIFLDKNRNELSRDQLEAAIGVRESEQLQKLQQSSKPTEAVTEAPLPEPSIAAEATVEPQVPGAGGAMGAAGATEKLASYKERKFGKRLVADEELAQEIRDKIGDRFYEPISNETTAAEARKVIEEQGIGQSINLIQDPTTALPYRIRSVIGQTIIKRLNKAAKALKEKSPEQSEFLYEQAADLSEWAIKVGTDAGQTVQSFAMWDALSPEGKLFQVQRMVKRTRDRIKPDVKAIVDTVNGQGDAKGKLKALRELAKTNRTARKIKSQFADIVKASEEQLLTEEGFYERVGDRLGLPKFTKEIAAEVRRLAEAIDDAPEGLKTEATLKLSRYIAALKGFDPKDVPLGVYYGNLLSGYNTQAINALDTFSHVIFEANNQAFINPKAAAQIYRGLARGLERGISTDFMLALKEGRQLINDKQLADAPRLMEIAKFGEKGGVPVKTDTTLGRVVKRVAESKIAYPLRGWKYVGHLMQASDSIMHHGLREARISLLADRIGRTEGLKGDALRNRVNELLAETPEQTADFVKQAESEGFTGLKLKQRVNQLRDAARPEAAVEDAYDFAGEGTYNHKTHGLLGSLADAAGKQTEKYKSGKLIIPFTQIVANVMNRRLDYSPYGFKRAFWGYSGEAAPIGDARSAAIMRASVGTAVLTYAALKLDIHGAGPTDPEKRKQLLDAGWKPYSIKIGNNYYSTLTSPLGLTLGMVGNWKDVDRYNEMGQADAVKRLIYTVSKVPSTMFAQSFLSNLGGWLGIVADQPGLVVSSIRSRIAALVGSATTPRIVTDLTKIWDPRVYRSDDLLADTLRNTPFAALVGRPQLNAFGEDVKLPTNRFISTVSKDPVWQFVLEKGVRISVPDKYTNVPDGEGGKRRILPDEYYNFLKQSGQEVKEYISNNMDTLTALESNELQDVLSDEAERIRKRVKTEQFSQ